MAFSETLLTFGVSPVTFAATTLLGYSVQNEKAGAFNIRRKETISLEGLFENLDKATPITEHFKQIQNLINLSQDFAALKINGIDYGKAKFINFSFPTSVNFSENAARYSKFTIQLEIIKEDPDNNSAQANLPTDLAALGDNDGTWYFSRLTDLSEDFSFKLGEDGNFEASHSISFGYDNIDKLADTVVATVAADVANTFFTTTLKNLSSISSLYSSTDFQSSVNDYGSSLTEQSADLINYKFAYSKNYTVFSKNATNTSETITTEVSYKDDGSIEVSEKGRIKGKGVSYATARTNAITQLNVNLAGSVAYDRCLASFNRYLSVSDTVVIPKYNVSDTLQTAPVSITKDLTDITAEVGYEIKFTTNAAYSSPAQVHTYTINIKKDPSGIFEATKEGSIKFTTNKRKNFINNIAAAKTAAKGNAITQITAYYIKFPGSLASYAGIETNTSMSVANFGAEISYSLAYSNSPILTASGVGVIVRSLMVNESHQNPVNKFSTVKLLGSTFEDVTINRTITQLGKEIIYQTRQLSEGTRNITLEMKIDREQLYSGESAGSNALSEKVFKKIKDLFTNEMLHKTTGYLFKVTNPVILQIFSKIYQDSNYKTDELTFFMDDLKLSIDNNYTLRVNAVFKFLVAKEQL